MKLKITYKRLKGYLMDSLGYSEEKARWTISALRKINPCILEAFLNWFYTAEFPQEPLFGINVKALSDRRSLDPVTAFLTVDWAAREPKMAKDSLSAGHDTLRFGDAEAEYIQKIMDANGWEFEPYEEEMAESEKDLEVD